MINSNDVIKTTKFELSQHFIISAFSGGLFVLVTIDGECFMTCLVPCLDIERAKKMAKSLNESWTRIKEKTIPRSAYLMQTRNYLLL